MRVNVQVFLCFFVFLLRLLTKDSRRLFPKSTRHRRGLGIKSEEFTTLRHHRQKGRLQSILVDLIVRLAPIRFRCSNEVDSP